MAPPQPLHLRDMDLAELQADLADAFDHMREMALRTRAVLVRVCGNGEAAAPLGTPSPLGTAPRSDELADYGRLLLRHGKARRYLQAVVRAHEDLGAVLVQYEAGQLAGMSRGEFRSAVEDLFGKLAKALDQADAWLESWGKSAAQQSMRRPRLALLDELTQLGTEDLAEVLGVTPAVAARRRSRGEFGKAVKSGRRKFVAASAVKAVLEGGAHAQDQG